MERILLQDLIPKHLYSKAWKKVTTGSELLFLYELGKYTKSMLGKVLDLGDVKVLKNLHTSEHFSFVVLNGLDIGTEVPKEDLVSYVDKSRFYFTKSVEGVEFKAKKVDKWVYSFDHNTQANMVMHGADRAQAYLSLIAYVWVKAYKDGIHAPKVVIDHERYTQLEQEYVELIILQQYGAKILEHALELKKSDNVSVQPEWEAFVINQRQKGFMDKEYSAKEKHKYLVKNFQIGDVVLLYTTKKGSKNKTIYRLQSCYPAVIENIQPTQVTLRYYPIIQTRLTREVQLSMIEDELDITYTDEDYARFSEHRVTHDLYDFGVDMLTYKETDFFLKALDYDGSKQIFRGKDGYEAYQLSTLDSIYTVFEDRKVKYDKELFLQKYFYSNNRIPFIEQNKWLVQP